MQSLCAPGRLAPTSHLLNGTLGFMDPKYRGVGLDPGISPEFLSDPGDGRVARLAEEPGGQGAKRRSDRKSQPSPEGGPGLAVPSRFRQPGDNKLFLNETRKNTGVLDRLPPADERAGASAA